MHESNLKIVSDGMNSRKKPISYIRIRTLPGGHWVYLLMRKQCVCKNEMKRWKVQRNTGGTYRFQTVNVREIKKIVDTLRQITGSKRTERGGSGCHVSEVLGTPSLTFKRHDLYLLSSSGEPRDAALLRYQSGFSKRKVHKVGCGWNEWIP